MGCYRLTSDERETILNYNEADNCWEVYTAVRKHMNKFDKLGWECTNIEYYPDGEISGKFYKVPNRAIAFRSPVKKELTEEQKKAAIERLQKYAWKAPTK